MVCPTGLPVEPEAAIPKALRAFDPMRFLDEPERGETESCVRNLVPAPVRAYIPARDVDSYLTLLPERANHTVVVTASRSRV
jgi:hypothetical protein